MTEPLPKASLDQLFHDFQTGNVQVRAVTPELDDIPAMLHQVASRLTLTAFAMAMTVATAIALPTRVDDYLRIGLSLFTTVCATVGWLVLFAWHWVGRGKPLRVTPLLRFLRR